MNTVHVPDWSLGMVKSILESVRLKDEETYGHCVRVGNLCRFFAQACGFSAEERKIIELSGLLHDIGKIGISDAILNKPDELTIEEYDIMKKHPEMSVQILEPLMHLEFFKILQPGILHHHERFDGRGYPHGLDKHSIPIQARLILICDTFDAMTADRAYRKGLRPEVAFQEIKDHSGRQFDPELVKLFLDAHPEHPLPTQEETLFKAAG